MKRVLYIVILISLIFLWANHWFPASGYLAFSETFYTIETNEFEDVGIEGPSVLGNRDYNIPPLFVITQYLLHGGTATPIDLRELNILLHILNIILVYLIVKQLHDERTGVAVGILYATIPSAVILALTAIPETFMIFWMLLAVHFHLRDEPHFTALALMFGLLTKQPVVIIGIILIVDYYRKNRDMVFIPPLMFFLMFAGLGGFYIIHGLMFGAEFLDAIGDRAGVASVPCLGQLVAMLYETMEAGNFLMLLILAAIPLKWRAIKDSITAQAAICYLIFFIFYHHHSYYVFPVIVFGLLMSSTAIKRWLKGDQYLWIIIVIIVLNAAQTASLVHSNRSTYAPFDELDCNDSYVASDDFVSYWWPVIKYNCPESDVWTCEETKNKTQLPSIEFGNCVGTHTNPNWFRPIDGRCQLIVSNRTCPIEDDAPTFKWDSYF